MAMPQYEFYCKDCKKTFSKILTLSEYEKGDFKCPVCKSKKVEQRLASFYAVTSKKS
jgi:putative FmdB family regulatory protein